MRLGIMQPYLFPYIGYFQYISLIDKWVVYDDVAFIKQGWVNRNRILLNGKDFTFSVPIKDISSFRQIKETNIDEIKYKNWLRKFLKTLEQAYKKAPNYEPVLLLVKNVFDSESTDISKLAYNSLQAVCKHLNIDTPAVETSEVYNNSHLHAQQRVIDICKKEGADKYLNVIGGTGLYSKADFQKEKIELDFIASKPIVYKQLGNEFVPWLSIIDVLMFNTIAQTQDLLTQFEIK